jgi:predicted outer membrane repeat protein
MNITNCNNTNGGAVSVSDADATFTSVAFHNNYAANGGALYVQDGSVVLDEVTCSNNEALTGGGCVSVSRARVSISTSSNIRCNKAASHLGEDIFCSKGSLTLPSTVSTWMTEMGISCVSCGVPFGMCGQKQTDECTPIVIPPGEEGICASPSRAMFFFSLFFVLPDFADSL